MNPIHPRQGGGAHARRDLDLQGLPGSLLGPEGSLRFGGHFRSRISIKTQLFFTGRFRGANGIRQRQAVARQREPAARQKEPAAGQLPTELRTRHSSVLSCENLVLKSSQGG